MLTLPLLVRLPPRDTDGNAYESTARSRHARGMHRVLGRWQHLYKRSGTGDGIPVILLHGGPEFTAKAVRAQLNTSDPR